VGEGPVGSHTITSVRWCLAAGALSAAIGVALGAFGAHGLRSLLSAEFMAIFETGIRYQMYHAGGLFAVGFAGQIVEPRKLRHLSLAGWAFSAGTVVFSGSLYALSLTGLRELGAITPVGGILFLAGWGMFIYSLLGARNG